MVEQLTLNQLVTGSSPAPATTFKTRRNAGLFFFYAGLWAIEKNFAPQNFTKNYVFLREIFTVIGAVKFH